MDLTNIIKAIKKRELGRQLLIELRQMKEKDSITYLDEYKYLQEYKILELFTSEKLLYKEQKGAEGQKGTYFIFRLTKEGSEYFTKPRINQQ